MASPESLRPDDVGSPETPSNDELQVTIHHHGRPHALTFPSSATISDLSDYVSVELAVPPSNQKFLISPKPGLIKPPFRPEHAVLLLSTVCHRKITLLGNTPAEISSLTSSIRSSRTQNPTNRARTGPVKPTEPSRSRDWQRLQDATSYTFLQLRPLPYLSNPNRSLRFLERLRDDPGIRAAMRAHRWSVPLLTEMNPADHTTHESRTLGLNRNAGEVIELRLRTDAYDGYRDYKTIRKTLCHELAHNVYGEHDRDFWELCHAIEKEVEKGDWKSGGKTVGQEEFYEPPGWDGSVLGEDEVADHGGWTGGDFVLGGGGSGGIDGSVGNEALGRREIIARAAEERMRRQRQQNREGGSESES